MLNIFFIADLVCYFLLTFNLTNIILCILQLSFGLYNFVKSVPCNKYKLVFVLLEAEIPLLCKKWSLLRNGMQNNCTKNNPFKKLPECFLWVYRINAYGFLWFYQFKVR